MQYRERNFFNGRRVIILWSVVVKEGTNTPFFYVFRYGAEYGAEWSAESGGK